jgi:hypothetical protein
MSRNKGGFKGDDGNLYHFFRRTIHQGGKKIREITVRFHHAARVFKLVVGVVSTFAAFEEWVASGFSISKGAILVFAFAGL